VVKWEKTSHSTRKNENHEKNVFNWACGKENIRTSGNLKSAPAPEGKEDQKMEMVSKGVATQLQKVAKHAPKKSCFEPARRPAGKKVLYEYYKRVNCTRRPPEKH